MKNTAANESPLTWDQQSLQAAGVKVDGDCFQAAAAALADAPPDAMLVHGEVQHATIPHLRYTHAWIEYEVPMPDGNSLWMVRDTANGKDITVPAVLYYGLGQIDDAPGKLCRYTREQASRKMLQTGHYGPWDLECPL